VIEVNKTVASDVGAIAQDPFGSGWIVKLRPSHAEADLAKLMDHDAYQKKIAEDAH
jgi:glycine cleavage system H protein